MKRIVGGKWGPCAGQACIGVDYLLVQKKLAPHLVLGKSSVHVFVSTFWLRQLNSNLMTISFRLNHSRSASKNSMVTM